MPIDDPAGRARPRKPGVIRADESYTLAEFEERNRMGKAARRTAVRDGLIIRRVGRQSYILGRDWLAYLERKARKV